MKKNIAIGLVGPILDAGMRNKRWEKWRPTVAVCQQDQIAMDRFELLYQEKYTDLANQLAKDIQEVSPLTQVNLHKVVMRDPWDFEEVYGALLDFCTDYEFQPSKENYHVHITTGTHVAQICLYLLTEARYLPGMLFQTSPPNKKKGTPATHSVIDLDLSKYDRIAQRFERQQAEGLSFLKAGIDTRNEQFNRTIEQIEQVAIRSHAPILITGETGVGKTQLARRIFELKKSRNQVSDPFVEVNCATLRGDAAMSTLFGHKKGAFTGASGDRDGLLKHADGGVLFLDEIGELGLDEQAMLLHAIEEKQFRPVGADKLIHSDFKLIAGTNRNLQERVEQGEFREDLLARINLWTFNLPGLRQRIEDFEPNIEFELNRFASEAGEHVTFNKTAKQAFLNFAQAPEALWKGNFRDLSASVTRMATLALGGRITPNEVKEETERLTQSWKSSNKQDQTGDPLIPADIDPFDRVQLQYTLEVCRAHKSMASAGRQLFAYSRQDKKVANDSDRLRKYLAKFDISWGQIHP